MANILIVDDDLDIAEVLSLFLQGTGHFVRMAHTGEDGLRVLRAAELPDCILLDVDMPVLSGPQMAHRMLLHDAGEELVPVVLVSARTDLAMIAQTIGTPYFLAKPVDDQVLLDLIARAVRERVAPSFAGMKSERSVASVTRASATFERHVTDDSLRVERDKGDAARRQEQAGTEDEADDVVRLARRRADVVLSNARDAEIHAREIHPVTEKVRAESRREGLAADAATRVERSTADEAVRRERSANQRILQDFLEAERALTDSSLEEERLQSDITVSSRDEFLGMVTHDLRNLLGGISMSVSLIAKNAPLEESGRATRILVASIHRVLGRMNRMIGDLQDIASIEAGKLRVDPAPADAHRAVVETLEVFREIAKSKDIALDFEERAPDSPLEARFDYGRVVQVLANLLSNAIKFTQKGGHIVIRVARTDEEVRFSVADNGPGIRTELLTAVFERYRQIRADRRGLGLGLYISKCIVEAHGGTIWAESQVGRGTTFYFTIPNDHA